MVAEPRDYGRSEVLSHPDVVWHADAPEMAELGLIEPLGNILSQLSQGGGAKGINIDAVSPLPVDSAHDTSLHLSCADSSLSCSLHECNACVACTKSQCWPDERLRLPSPLLTHKHVARQLQHCQHDSCMYGCDVASFRDMA